MLFLVTLFLATSLAFPAIPVFTQGRYEADGRKAQFDWPGVTFQIGFECPAHSAVEVHITFDLESSLPWTRTDGSHVFTITPKNMKEPVTNFTTNIEAHVPQKFTASLSLPQSSETNTYVFSVTKVTEALFGIITLHHIDVQVVSSTPLTCHGAFPDPPRSNLAIEFIGDSLTCGYGVLGKSPCSFSSATEDVTLAYASQTADLLNSVGYSVQYFIEAWSGKGVVRNYNGTAGPTMPELFPRTLANDARSSWDFRGMFIPDVVILLLGANDFSTPPQPPFSSFSKALDVLLDFIELQYPSLSHIVVACGPFDFCCYQDYQQKTVQARNDSRVHFYSLEKSLPDPSYPGPFTGCDAHPNVLGSKAMASKLAPYIHGLITGEIKD
jgi:lysophospholipase L1-like esterase